MNNRERLMDIMIERKLDRMEIADLLKVKRDEVDHWLLSHESKNHKEIPDMAIELLELKLGLKA
jgi:predicted transcriptional regulator